MNENNTILSEPTEEVEQQKKDLDQDELSAVFVNQAHKQFRTLTYGLVNRRKRALARVLEAVLFEPLEKVELTTKEEKELLDLCLKVMYHKGVVLKYAYERINKLRKGEETNEQEE